MCEAEDLPYDLLIEKTEGYSGSDIRLVCKEAAMQPLRRVMKELENKEEVVPEEGEYQLPFVLHPLTVGMLNKVILKLSLELGVV